MKRIVLRSFDDLVVVVVVSVLFLASLTSAQSDSQKQKQIPEADVISKSIRAVGYTVGGGSTKVVFVGTTVAPTGSGEAKVDAKKAGTEVKLKVSRLPQPTALGADFLTYVLWTITPDGTTGNQGKIRID
jgi:type II secretory pathway pseudopilin PulG